MPYPLSKAGQQAKEVGMSTQGVKYREQQGIPLSAPAMKNNNAKAWETRRLKLLAERQARMVWQARDDARREAREKRERERKRAMEARRAEQEKRRAEREAKRLEAAAERERREAAWTTITAAPRREWANPFAALVVRR
jgi:hypothetical protein